jgi:hypothetical protein
LSTAPKARRAKRVYIEGSNNKDDSDNMHKNVHVNQFQTKWYIWFCHIIICY